MINLEMLKINLSKIC